MMGTLYNALDGCTMIYLSIYFTYLSKDWIHFFTFYLIIFTICVLMIWYLPESPKYLVMKGKYKEARDALNVIAKVNKRPLLNHNSDIFK